MYLNSKRIVWLLVLFALLLIETPGHAYGVWEPEPPNNAIAGLDLLIVNLELMVQIATVNRSAHPEFLVDLESMVLQLKSQSQLVAEVYGEKEREVQLRPPTEPVITFLGTEVDRVGTGSVATPNGTNDGWIRFEQYFPEPVQLDSIVLYSSNRQGARGNSYWFSQNNPRAWILGVFQGETMLNPNREQPLGTFYGGLTLDLFANNTGQFDADNDYFLVEVTLNGVTESHLFRLTDRTVR